MQVSASAFEALERDFQEVSSASMSPTYVNTYVELLITMDFSSYLSRSLVILWPMKVLKSLDLSTRSFTAP